MVFVVKSVVGRDPFNTMLETLTAESYFYQSMYRVFLRALKGAHQADSTSPTPNSDTLVPPSGSGCALHWPQCPGSGYEASPIPHLGTLLAPASIGACLGGRRTCRGAWFLTWCLFAMVGSFMSYRKPYYYLWFSHGRCCGFHNGFPSKGTEYVFLHSGTLHNLRRELTSCRYSIRVGRSKDIRGPFLDKSGNRLTDGGGTTVYGSNHGVVYAPGGIGVLPGNNNRQDIMYYHYRECVRYPDTNS